MLIHVGPVTILWIMLGTLAFSKLDSLQNPKPFYSEFPNSINILASHMNFVQTENGSRIYLTGLLTNSSPVAWKSIEFDCRFFDAHGVMLDAGTGGSYATVQSFDEAAFRVAIIPLAPTNEYASFKIRVGSARNAKSWF
jgi:hypothetical protein